MSALQVERTIVIRAAAARVLAAFVDADDLREWWQVCRSVTVPRPLGAYAVEWGATADRDPVLGRLGGAFHGTVVEHQAGRELFVADAYWSPPDGDPLGPMALEVRCLPEGAQATRLIVRQTADDDGPRWQRYFAVVAAGWERALADLKRHLEADGAIAGRRGDPS